MPGVDKIELRLVQPASMFVSGELVKEAGIGTYIRGILSGSDFYNPLMVAGRWMMPGEGPSGRGRPGRLRKTRSMSEMSLRLTSGELGTDDWQVVGLYEPVFVGSFNADTIYAPLEALYQITKKYDKGTVLHVRTTSHDGTFTSAMAKTLKDTFRA